MEKTSNLIYGGLSAILVVNGISYYTDKTISIESVMIQIIVVTIICTLLIIFKKRKK